MGALETLVKIVSVPIFLGLFMAETETAGYGVRDGLGGYAP
jgi:hypothetical protein